MAEMIIEIIGWVGMVLVLIAYGMITAKKVNSKSFLYQALNLVGAAGILVNAYYNGAYPSVALNLIWGLIAIYGLASAMKIFKR